MNRLGELFKYNCKGQVLLKIRDKFNAFTTFGHRTWVEDMLKV